MTERRHFQAAYAFGPVAPLMRIVFFLLLAIAPFSGFSTETRSQPATIPTVSVSGKNYVRLTQWAQANKLRLQWIVAEKSVRATNSHSRLVFEISSRHAQINGVNFMLSLPVLFQNGTVYISATDLVNTVHPVLYPEKNETNSVIQTICLDPGHGGRDSGKVDGRMQEKRYTLLLAAEVEKLLKQSGFRVISTRYREDDFLELDRRPQLANEKGADLFISLHYNAAANRNVEGSEVYCLTPAGTSSSNGEPGDSPAPSYPAQAQNGKNVLLAYQIQKSLIQNLKVEDRGVKRSQFMVLLNPKCPAVLIEAGFMTNPAESKRIYDSEYRKRMAQAIVDGILAYKKIVER